MKSAAMLTLGCFLAISSPTRAQNIPGGSIPIGALGAMPSGPGFPVSDAATEINTYITAGLPMLHTIKTPRLDRPRAIWQPRWEPCTEPW